jgi:hypothetical protein
VLDSPVLSYVDIDPGCVQNDSNPDIGVGPVSADDDAMAIDVCSAFCLPPLLDIC